MRKQKILKFFYNFGIQDLKKFTGKVGGNIFMKCGVYVRVSTDDQRDNGYSIDSQLRMIKEYCEKNN